MLSRIGEDMKQVPRDLSAVAHEQTVALKAELQSIHDTFSSVLDESGTASNG